ncbi:MAG: ABC transporter ATP-binding protein [Phycisphaerales bacterium]|nr:ABC transporter ATP-binding protein [Phycisphaerales bacterium]
MIEATGLRKSFGSLEAVRGIDIRVERGQVVGFLGPNGAGKSTSMRMLSGYIEPDAGSIRIAGIDLAAEPLRAKRNLGYLAEGAPAYGDMRVEDFLVFVARTRGYRGTEIRQRVDHAIARVHLEPCRGQRIETLSKGYKRRTGIAQALLHDPPVLILDEPTDGLDPNQKFEVRQLVRELGKTRAIVLSTHILEEVEAVCTRAIIIDKGTTVFDGTPKELEARAPASVISNRLDHVFRELTARRPGASVRGKA